MRQRAALCLAVWCAAATVQAQGVRLGAILDMARESDAPYAAARAQAAAGREKLPQALAGLRPNVNLTHSMRRNRDGSTAYTGATGGYDAGSSALVLSQPLFRVANKLSADQAELQVQLTDQQLLFAEQELLLRVARAYFDVLQGGDEFSVARAQKDALAQQLAQAKRGFEVGVTPITDLNEAQARHDLAVAQEIAVRNELASRRRVLERSIARPLPALARLNDAASVALLDERQQDALVDAASKNGLLVQIGRSALQVADMEIRKRDAGHTPTLDFVASFSVNRGVFFTPSSGGNDTRQASIGLEIGFPVYQGGAVSSRVREAIAERQRIEQELLHAERQALLDAQQAQLGVQSGVALTQALRQAVTSSESQLRSSQRGLQVGVRTRLDVLNAEQQLYAARKDLAVARYRTLVATLQLKAVAGALTEADLRALDGLLED